MRASRGQFAKNFYDILEERRSVVAIERKQVFLRTGGPFAAGFSPIRSRSSPGPTKPHGAHTERHGKRPPDFA